MSKLNKILFISYGGGHVNMLKPAYDLLSKNKSYDLHYLALTTAQNILKKQKIPFFGFKDIINNNLEVLKNGQELLKTLKFDVVDKEESVAYLGLSFWDLVQKHGAEEAQSLYARKGRGAFLPTLVMEEFLKTFKPGLLITTNSPRAEKAALLSAKRLGIPSICISDHYTASEIEDRLKISGYGSKICVSLPIAKKKLIEAGRPAEEIVVTGNPAFDHYGDITKVPHEIKTILWARTPKEKDQEGSDKTESILLALCEKNNWKLVIRLHPNEDKSYEPHKNLEISTHKLDCLLYTSPSPRDATLSRMPSSA